MPQPFDVGKGEKWVFSWYKSIECVRTQVAIVSFFWSFRQMNSPRLLPLIKFSGYEDSFGQIFLAVKTQGCPGDFQQTLMGFDT